MIPEQSSEPMMQWAYTFLDKRGCYIKSLAVPIRIMPWSCVYRIETSVGSIYLKQMAAPFVGEASLLLHLGSLFPYTVPEIVGHHDALACFLMFDAGSPLRERLKKDKDYQTELATKGLTMYATIQQETMNTVDHLLAMGVPDWSLAVLPSLYEELLNNQQNFLLEDGLTETLIEKLNALCPKVSKLCKQLMQYKIPPSIEHGDFHDNNLLINQQDEIVISDWGDAVISHPFFSIASFLDSAERNHGISENTIIYKSLRDSYLKLWKAFESESRLLEAFELAKRLNPIKFSLSFYRVAQCSQMEGLGEFKGTIAEALQEFLKDETC